MANYNIPKQFQPGFSLIANLAEEQFEVIREVLVNFTIGSGPNEVIKALETKLPLKRLEIRNIINTIFSLIALNVEEEMDQVEFVSKVVSSYTAIKSELEQSKLENLSKYLLKFINADGKIRLTIKAKTLFRENYNNYNESRIISDIRIVFEEKLDNPKQCAVVIHQLKIDYDENEDSKELYIAMDNDDLMQLRESINRAIEKDKLIRNNTFKDLTFIDFIKQ